MQIGEFARRAGITPSTVRYYEERSMFSPGQIVRGANGYRRFTEEALRRVELVLAGRAVGFSLDDMRTRMGRWDEMADPERRQILEEQLRVLDERLAELSRRRQTVVNTLAVLDSRGS